MSFDMKTWGNPISLDANNLNRIEQGIKNAHDTLDITNGEVSNLQINQTRIIEELNTLTSSAPSILKTLTQIETLLANNDISTILNSTEAFLLKGSQTLTAEELTQVYKNLKLDSFLKLTNIKVNNKSVVHGSEVNIPLDSSLDINSDNAISNRAVASALKNINLSGKIPTKLADLKQDDSYMTVSKEEKDFWNSPRNISESDPTVPDWAKTPNKPKYTYAEIIDAPTVYDDNQYLKNGAGYTTETRATDIATTVFNTNITTFETTKVTPFNNRISIIEGQLPVLSELLNNHNHDTLYSKLNHTHQDLKDYIDTATINKASKDHTHTKSEITDFTHTHTKSEITDFGNYLTATSSLKEAYLEWGGKAIAGAVSPLDTAISNRHNANRFAFAKPAGIIIEYSTDGSTYSTYSTTDTQKINLVSGLGQTYNIGARSTGNTVNDKLRVTLIGGTMGVYTLLRKLLLNISTNYATGCNVKIEYSMHTSQDTFNTLGTYSLSGWSGWNSIPIGLTYGGANSWSAYALRLTFGITGINSNQTSNNLQLFDIVGIGDTAWSSPSTMAKTGHLYNYDSDQNALFPASINVNNGSLFVNKGAIIKGRIYGSGDDEGIIVGYAENGYAGLMLGGRDGRRSCLYLKDGASGTSAPFWRYVDNNGTSSSILHPCKEGTIALTSDIPTTLSLTSKGSQAPQQNRTQAYEDIYTYNTYSTHNNLMPTSYTSVIGFGDGAAGTVELAGCWTSEMGLWYRALRDCNDNWWPWQQIITQRGGTIASGYSLTIEGSIIV